MLETFRLCHTIIFPFIRCYFAGLCMPFSSFRSVLCALCCGGVVSGVLVFTQNWSIPRKLFRVTKRAIYGKSNALLWWWWGRQRVGVSVFNFSFPVLLPRSLDSYKFRVAFVQTFTQHWQVPAFALLKDGNLRHGIPPVAALILTGSGT